jgi:hypothetical protein
MVPVPERCATSARILYRRSAFHGFGFLCVRPQGNPENNPPGVRSGPPRAAEDKGTKGTGHLLGANWLISLETDFHSLGAPGRRGWS